MAFEKVVPEWNAPGVEPPKSLKDSGFTSGYKPPAEYFNWLWYNVSACLNELQNHGLTLEEAVEKISKNSLPLTGGTLTGELTLSGDPVDILHAVTKRYVDTCVENLQSIIEKLDESYLPLSGGTLTGNLTLSNDPEDLLHAATKQYVDNCIKNLQNIIEKLDLTGDYLPISGGTLTGPLMMKKVDNGYMSFHKNHDNTNDYGTQLTDYDVNGNWFRLYLSALNKRITVRDNINNIGYELYGQHNPEQLKNDLAHNIKTYTELSQIGLTIGSETIDDIAANLPNLSLLVYAVTSLNATIYPSNYGLVTVKRTSAARIEFNMVTTAGVQYTGFYTIVSAGNTWTDWVKVYSTKAMPSVEEIGAAASSHTHAAGNINSGTFNSTAVKAKTGTDYTTYRIRNIALKTTAETPANGDLLGVYS